MYSLDCEEPFSCLSVDGRCFLSCKVDHNDRGSAKSHVAIK